MAKEPSMRGNAPMEDTSSRTKSIWLEVANVRATGKNVEIQVKGERTEREPAWLTVQESAFEDSDKAYRALTEGLDKKRIVLAELVPIKETIQCKHIRIQYAESSR